MYIDIHLQNFRSYIDESFELSPEVNIIIGPNASGKTNLLEAFLVASRGITYKGRDTDLINFNNDWARLEANTDSYNRIVKLQRNPDDKVAKSYEINTQKISRLNLNQTIPIVLFEPNDLLLLIGSPESRRNYLDDVLEQTKPDYRPLKNHYKRALAQRNSLLKRTDIKNPELFVWNIRLSELGGKIYKERINLLDKLNQDISSLYSTIANSDEKIELIYKTKINPINYESELLKKLELSLENDTIRGFTSNGPHRDDIQIIFNSKIASEVASRGETRSILLSMKIIETKVIEESRSQKPLLLFDDVFSELDGSRRLALTKMLKGYQAIITTTDADVVVQHFMDSNNIIPLNLI